jgi:hypothetical protein
MRDLATDHGRMKMNQTASRVVTGHSKKYSPL